jgi:hypothetical protein
VIKKEIISNGKSSINSNVALGKVERLFDLHKMQLLSAWDSLTDSEKSQMLKMFDKMYEKMQSMSFSDHMKHMSKMMMNDKHHDSKYEKSGCSCEEGEHSIACESGEEGCTCSEDGICNCREGSTCATYH